LFALPISVHFWAPFGEFDAGNLSGERAAHGSIGAATAQTPAETTVERSVKTLPTGIPQIGVYLNVLPDCTSGRYLPSDWSARLPQEKVVVKSAGQGHKLQACLALDPAYVAFYKSPPEFLGDDVLTIEVKYAGDVRKFRR